MAGVANTFVYTVLLMVITGLTMYLVYGRANRKGKPGKRSPAIPAAAAPLPGPSLAELPAAKEPVAPLR